MLISLIAIAAAIFGLVGGSFWIFSGAIGYLFLKMYPLTLLIVVIVSVGMLVLRHYWRQ